jgi:hypothetical protein
LDLAVRPLALARVAFTALASCVARVAFVSLTACAAWAQEPGAPPSRPPTLVALGTRSGLAAQAGPWRALLAADPLLDLGVQGRTLPADSPDGRALGARLRQSWGLGPGPAAWVLLDGQGELLAADGSLPEAEALAQILEAAGLRSPVRVLQAFLGAHPDHAEARLDLVRALRPRLRARLAELEPGELAPDTDARIWGPMAQELDLLFRTADWSSLGLNLDRDLQLKDRPERFSPAMRALYRRHLPQLQADLLRCPQNPPVWFNLLRMDQVLGEQTLLATLAAVPWFQVRPTEAAQLPYGPMAQALHREAVRTGAWRQAMTVELALWRQLVRPKLCFFGKAGLLPPGAGPEARQPWLLAERETIWSQLLAPLIEAMVRAGAEGEVPGLLGELDASWGGIAWPNRFQRLARTLGRPDLARVWLAAVRQSAPEGVLERLPGWDRVLLVQGQPQAPKEPGAAPPPTRAAYARPFRRLGMTLGLQLAPPAWRRLLGWNGTQPRWALVDGQGQILLQGEQLPAPEPLMADYRARGLPVDLDQVLTFRQDHPEHLGALAAEVRIRGVIASAHRAERWASATSERLGGAETEAWQAYVRAMESLLQDPMGTCPGLLRTAQVQVPGPDAWEAEAGSQGLDALAARLLPRLEADLARRPSGQELWWLWLAFAPYQGRSMAALLEAMAPSPVTPSGAWPSHGILAAGAASLRNAERWQEVVDLLQPRWRERAAAFQQQQARPGARYGFSLDWSWELTRPLLEALLHLGQTQDADAILEALDAAGGRRPGAQALRPLCDLARELGLDSWARRWQAPG